jgi:DNA-binding transcriptional ArsR family regulator
MNTGGMTRLNAVGMALSDPNRVRALMALRNGELCVCQLIELLQLAPSTVSKHMSILKQAGLVASRKDSRWVYYRSAEKEDDGFISALSDLVVDYLAGDKATEADDEAMVKIKIAHPRNRC